jgi:hypothetical protein
VAIGRTYRERYIRFDKRTTPRQHYLVVPARGRFEWSNGSERAQLADFPGAGPLTITHELPLACWCSPLSSPPEGELALGAKHFDRILT